LGKQTQHIILTSKYISNKKN